jgi:hypothetical protein
MKTYKRQIQEEGLDKSSTYCTGDYKKPVGNVTEQIKLSARYCSMLISRQYVASKKDTIQHLIRRAH